MIDRKYLPSKKFLVSLALAIMVILIAIALNYSREKRANDGLNNLVAGTNATSSILATINNIDSDHDSLPDWQEVLYGTDPKNSDTDKDNSTDGEEIKANRDPLKANTASKQNPNDQISAEIIAGEQKISEEYDKLNPIEKMARNLMSNIIASQPASGQIDQTTTTALVQKAIEDLPQKHYAGITKISDLKLVSVDPKVLGTNLLAYANSYYAQTEAFRKIMGQDLIIISNNISNNKAFEKEKINQITTKYQNIINNLIKIPLPAVPDSAGAIYHLALINEIEKLIAIDGDIIKSENDASGLLSNLAEYNKTLNSLVLTLSVMDSVLKIKR